MWWGRKRLPCIRQRLECPNAIGLTTALSRMAHALTYIRPTAAMHSEGHVSSSPSRMPAWYTHHSHRLFSTYDHDFVSSKTKRPCRR